MLTVNGYDIYVDELEVLNNIKEQVLQQQGREILRKIKKSGQNIMVCCPIHHDGQERKPSCGILIVNKKDHKAGEFHCFSCGAVGTFEEFVSACFGYDDKGEFGKAWLMENYVSGDEFERPDIYEIEGEKADVENKLSIFNKLLNVQAKKNVEKPKYISEEELASYRFYHPYMWQRHLTPEVVERYDVGYQKDYRLPIKKEDGTIEYGRPIECLTFPCRDIDGNCLFVSRRAIHNKNFFLPLDIDKPVYGVFELPKGAKDVVICESVFNALTCATWGIPAVALFGTGNSNQYQQLADLPIRHYVLGLDPDEAGDKGSYKLKKYLGDEKELTKLIIPKGKDINDLSYAEFMSLQEITM